MRISAWLARINSNRKAQFSTRFGSICGRMLTITRRIICTKAFIVSFIDITQLHIKKVQSSKSHDLESHVKGTRGELMRAHQKFLSCFMFLYCFVGYMTCKAVLLEEPNVVRIPLFQFSHEKVINHDSVEFPINFNNIEGFNCEEI